MDLPESLEKSFSQRSHWAGDSPISALMARALADPSIVSLAAGFVDQESLPTEATKTALDAIFSDANAGRAALQYGSTPGDATLRQLILDRLREDDGCPYTDLSIDQIIITPGSNQLLHLAADSLVDPGDIILCSAPTYFVYMGSVQNMGANTYGLATDDDGIIPAALEETLNDFHSRGELHRVKALYLVPYFDNPRGVSTSTQRREEIVEILQRWSKEQWIYLLEDAAYRELRYQGEDTRSTFSLDETHERVIYAGTFSKSFSPGIRVGWGVLPKSIVEPICSQKGNLDFGSPQLNQAIIAKVIELGLYDPHILKLRKRYAEKMAAMLSAAESFLGPIEGVEWLSPQGGLYVWVTLPSHIDAGSSSRLFEVATQERVLYVPGEFSFPSSGVACQKNSLRLSFGVQSNESIAQGVESLSHAIKRVVAES